jgi:TolB-like protein
MSNGVESVPRERPSAAPPANFWARIKEHKVLQWSLAYLAAALALAHAQDLVAHAFGWPGITSRIAILVLAVGFPVAVTLAWYHGHKGLRRVGHGELMLLAMLSLIGAGLLIALVRPGADRASRAGVAPAQSIAVPAASVAVVPFANLTGDPSKEYFSDGMAEELIDVLSQVPGLKVPARTSSFAYKGRNTDIRRIAQDLGVATILEGSVRSAGERIRVTAQLVDAKSGYHLWSHSYDHEFADIFKLQDELAASIVQALQGTMNTGTPSLARAPPTQDLEAYQLDLQARSVLLATEQSVGQSLGLLDQALARDPRFARALADRALVRVAATTFGFSQAAALENAKRDAEQGLALDPSLAEAHQAVGAVSALRGDWLKAEASYRRAIGAKPIDPRALRSHVHLVLQSVGQMRQARSQAAEAYRLAPADSLSASALSVVDSRMGLDAEAMKLANLAVALGMPASAGRLPQVYVMAALRGARYKEAAILAVGSLPAPARAAGAAEVVRLVYTALADPARKPAARQALQALSDRLGSHLSPQEALPLFTFLFTQLDALDAAYDRANHYLDELTRSGIVGGAWGYLWVPEMRSFRKDPRFQAFVARLKLIDYWKQYGPPDECDLHDDMLVCQ